MKDNVLFTQPTQVVRLQNDSSRCNFIRSIECARPSYGDVKVALNGGDIAVVGGTRIDVYHPVLVCIKIRHGFKHELAIGPTLRSHVSRIMYLIFESTHL